MTAEAGKDVSCTKPCGLTIRNCQEIAETFVKDDEADGLRARLVRDWRA